MKPALFLGVFALAMTGFAGCLDTSAPQAALQGQEAPKIDLHEGMEIVAHNCIQGGGNSVYKGKTKIGPFDSANQLPELGNPTVGAFGAVFAPGDASYGIWHVATVCESYTYEGKEYKNFGMGWIAQMIEKPAFDDGDQRLTFMVADLSFNNQDFVTKAGEATKGAEISPSSQTLVEWMVPQKYMHVIISEASHGTFEFTAEIHKQFGKKESEHIRFWMLPSTDGEMHHDHGFAAESAADPLLYRPIAVDIIDTANGKGIKLAGESLGTFTHFPDPNQPAENHVGNPLGHYQDGFDRTIRLGPMPEGITFDKTWLH